MFNSFKCIHYIFIRVNIRYKPSLPFIVSDALSLLVVSNVLQLSLGYTRGLIYGSGSTATIILYVLKKRVTY